MIYELTSCLSSHVTLFPPGALRYQCTRDLPRTFTYGTPMRHVLSGALDIATARTSCSLPPEDLARLDLILATRRRLQAADFTGFIGLLQTMKKMDKVGKLGAG